MSRFLLTVAVLVVVFLLVLASLAPWDIAIGALLGTGLVIATRSFVFGGWPAPVPGLARRVLAFFPFAAIILWDILRGTWRVTLVVLHVRPLRSPGIVAVPIGERTRLGVAVSMLAMSLSPGSFLIDIDEQKGEMLVHMLDASDPDAVRAELQEFYQRYQRHVFP